MGEPRVDFDAGYDDAMAGRPSCPASLEYLRGYDHGLLAARLLAEASARRAPCVLPLESEAQLLAELGPPCPMVLTNE